MLKHSGILFLSAGPHPVFHSFARAVNAEARILPLHGYERLLKKMPFLHLFHLLFSLILSLFIKTEKHIFLAEGGTTIYIALFLKMRKKDATLIYLDGDLFFFGRLKNIEPFRRVVRKFLKGVDGVITISKQNLHRTLRFIDAPIEVCLPYPKEVRRTQTERKNYGLYIGRLDADKNVKRILRFGLQCPYFERFFVVGDGIFRRYVERLSAKNPKLVYLRSRHDIAPFYSECKFLIHIPDRDPFACVVAEAMLCGCFPIVSKGVGSHTLLDPIFVIDDPNDFDAINRRIKFILENEDDMRRIIIGNTSRLPLQEEAIRDFREKFEAIMKEIGR